MLKSIPLIQAIIKGFVRNKKAIFLLVAFPLILITIIFSSLKLTVTQSLPVGVVNLPSMLESQLDVKTLFSYLDITNFNSLNDCLSDLKKYNQYLCIELLPGQSLTLNSHYDNTRGIVIFEVLNRIKGTIDYLQKEKTRELAGDFIARSNEVKNKVENFGKELGNSNSKINEYITETEGAISGLYLSRNDLLNTINSMEEDVSQLKSVKSNLKREKDSLYLTTSKSISNAENSISLFTNQFDKPPAQIQTLSSAIRYLSDVKREIDDYNFIANVYFIDADNKIREYEDASAKGKSYISDIDTGISKLKDTKEELVNYKYKISDSQKQLDEIESDFSMIIQLDPDALANPINIYNTPTYLPRFKNNKLQINNSRDVEQIIKGINFLDLQTFFPVVLFLIILFLSLLISTFICLSEINSSANERIRIVNGIFMHEIIATYLASLIIIFVPIFCILLLGNYLFRLPIFSNFTQVSLILFLISSIFILFGMGLSYLIRKESITLLVSTFILVLLTFYSGFIIPTERMSAFAGNLANNLPANIGLSAFNKAIFYEQGFSSTFANIQLLFIWFVILGMIVVVIKRVRN